METGQDFVTELVHRPPQTFEIISEFFSQSDFEHFSAVDTQTAVLVSIANVESQHRIPKHLILVFWVCTADFGFLLGDKIFLRRLSRNLGSQHQLRSKTLIIVLKASDIPI